MPITDELRRYAGSAVGQGRTQLLKAGSGVHVATDRLATLIEHAPRPSTAALGAADIAMELITRRAETATRRVEHVPIDYSRARTSTRARLSRSQEDALVAIAKAQEEAQARLASIRARIPLQHSPSGSFAKLEPAALRGAATSSLDWAKHVLAAVNERGQSRLQTGTDPRISRVMLELDQAADSVQGRARPILEAFSARVEAILTQLGGEIVGSPQPPAGSETVNANAPIPDDLLPDEAVQDLAGKVLSEPKRKKPATKPRSVANRAVQADEL